MAFDAYFFESNLLTLDRNDTLLLTKQFASIGSGRVKRSFKPSGAYIFEPFEEIVMERIPISVQGYERIEKELAQLKKDRPEVIKAIAEAREEGDLKENAGYHAARERQGIMEARIALLQSRMPYFNVVDLDTLEDDGIIGFGATVVLEDLDTEETKTYTILGADEADHARDGSISSQSPVAQALLGKEEGDEIAVDAPRGRIEYEIVSVKYLGTKYKDA